MNLTEAHQWWRKKHQQAHSEFFLYRHLEKHIYFFFLTYAIDSMQKHLRSSSLLTFVISGLWFLTIVKSPCDLIAGCPAERRPHNTDLLRSDSGDTKAGHWPTMWFSLRRHCDHLSNTLAKDACNTNYQRFIWLQAIDSKCVGLCSQNSGLFGTCQGEHRASFTTVTHLYGAWNNDGEKKIETQK